MTLAATHPGWGAVATRQETAVPGPLETPAHRKLVKAAQEFEGMLISQLLGDFKEGLASPGGDASLAGSDSLNSLAIQNLSEALARRGGLGIGQMLIHQLDPEVGRGRPVAEGWKD